MNITPNDLKVLPLVRINHQSFVTALQKVAILLMPNIEPLRVRTLQPAHADDQIRLGRLQKQMVVISHQNIGMNQPARATARLAEGLQERLMVGVISEDRLSAIPTTHHMVNGSLVLNSRFPWHAQEIHVRDRPVNTRIRGLTPSLTSPTATRKRAPAANLAFENPGA